MLREQLGQSLLEFAQELMDDVFLAFFVHLLFVGLVNFFFFLLEFYFPPEGFFVKDVLNRPVSLNFLGFLCDLGFKRVLLADS